MKPIIEEKLDAIEIPENLHERCVAGAMKAKSEMEERTMNKNQIKKTVAAAAVALVCVFAVGSTTFADSIKGMFKDIVRFDGAVTGSEYVSATDEVGITAGEVTVIGAEVLVPVEITILNPETVPFSEIEWVEVDAFEVLNADGDIAVSEEDANVVGSVNGGAVNLLLRVEAGKLVAGENYTLVIESFEGCKKADAPLPVKGEWECTFEVR